MPHWNQSKLYWNIPGWIQKKITSPKGHAREYQMLQQNRFHQNSTGMHENRSQTGKNFIEEPLHPQDAQTSAIYKKHTHHWHPSQNHQQSLQARRMWTAQHTCWEPATLKPPPLRFTSFCKMIYHHTSFFRGHNTNLTREISSWLINHISNQGGDHPFGYTINPWHTQIKDTTPTTPQNSCRHRDWIQKASNQKGNRINNTRKRDMTTIQSIKNEFF